MNETALRVKILRTVCKSLDRVSVKLSAHGRYRPKERDVAAALSAIMESKAMILDVISCDEDSEKATEA